MRAMCKIPKNNVNLIDEKIKKEFKMKKVAIIVELRNKIHLILI